MKKILFLSTFLLTCFCVFAQTASKTEGVISFEEKINMHRRIQNEEMKARIPEFRSSNMELTFKGDECMYKAVEEDDEETNNGNVRMVFRRPAVEIYRNFATNKKVEYREMMDKKYLIEGEMAQPAWKLGTETKKIVGYDCTQATLNDTARKQEIVAWFTMDLPLAAGPQSLGSLPGMILELDINKGETVITAKKIDFKSVKDNAVKAPTKGEKITEEEFKQKREEFMKRNGGGGPNFRINRQ
ncbi:MAG: GLPGLI family protein [Saprospiraceae bacterium]|nr:GLPGLI family protein [Saprospiraceae bacterium]